MPCLALRKGFSPAIKTWKSFTIKILQKLHPGKIIKISKASNRAKATRPRAQPPMYYPTLPSKKSQHQYTAKNCRQLFGASKALHRPKHQYRFKKQSLPAPPTVFIDELFWTQTRDVEKDLSGSTVLGGPTGKPVPVTRPALVGPEVVPRASPRLRGIDARAEEFITRFRAELEYQENVAHGL